MKHMVVSLLIMAAFCTVVLSRSVKKHDQCPNTEGIFTICVVDPTRGCGNDGQCPKGYKCCPYGGGRECLAVSTHDNHLGSCPKRKAMSGNKCKKDMDCKMNEKCCQGYCSAVRKYVVPIITYSA